MPRSDEGVLSLIRSMRAASGLEVASERPPDTSPDFADRESGLEMEAFSRLRRERNGQAAENARLEVEQLKRLLAEQEAARKSAHATAVTAQQQVKLHEADSQRLLVELQRTREQLSNVKRALPAAVAIRRVQYVPVATGVSGKKWFAAALVFVTVCTLAAAGLRKLNSPAARDDTAPQADSEPAPVAPIATSSPRQLTEQPTMLQHPSAPLSRLTGSAGTQDFSEALGNLDDALGNFKGANPDDVLRKVHKENATQGVSVCSFAWNGGQISLLYGSKEGRNPEDAILRCAEAVKRSAK